MKNERRGQRAGSAGALLLVDYPSTVVTITCEACARRGRYAKTKLLDRYGAGKALPDLLSEIAKDCPRRTLLGARGCEAAFAELKR